MKKLFALSLTIALLFTLSACGEKAEDVDSTGTTTTTITEENGDDTTTAVSSDTTDDTATTTVVTETGGATTSAATKTTATTTAKTTTTAQKTSTTATSKYTQITQKTTKPQSTTKNTTTTQSETPRFPEYYELSRKTSSSVTIESMFRKVYAYSENIAGYGGGTPETEDERTDAIYSFDGSADQLQHMDIYGYNLTLDDLCGSGFGSVDFWSELVGPNLKVDFKSADGHANLPLRNKDDILVCMKNDVATLKNFLGNKYGAPSISLNYGSYASSFDQITDDMLKTAADCNRNTLRVTITDVKVDGKTFNMTFSFSSNIDFDSNKHCYNFSISIHTIR